MHTESSDYLQQIASINDRVVALRHDLHAHPELSGKEEHTKYLIKGILEAEGFRVREFDDCYGIIADLVQNEGAPYIALRADIDALPIQERTNAPYASRAPGIMHACGHDSHTAVLLGTALAFGAIRDQLAGNLRFIFQPAEEITEGGQFPDDRTRGAGRRQSYFRPARLPQSHNGSDRVQIRCHDGLVRHL